MDGLYFEISCADTGFNEKVSTNLEGLSPEISDLPIYNSDDELLKYKVSELGVLNDDGTYSLPYKYNKPRSVTVTLDTDTVTFASIKNTVKTGSVKLTKQTAQKLLADQVGSSTSQMTHPSAVFKTAQVVICTALNLNLQLTVWQQTALC